MNALARGLGVVLPLGLLVGALSVPPAAGAMMDAAPLPSMALPALTNVGDNCRLGGAETAVDYGVVRNTQLERMPDGLLALPERTVSLSVSCPSPRLIAIKLSALQANDGIPRFGQAGAVRVTLSAARLDGRAAEMLVADRLGPAVSSAVMRVGDTVLFPVSGTQVPSRNLTLQVMVSPRVPIAEAQVRDQTQWQADLQFELVLIDP